MKKGILFYWLSIILLTTSCKKWEQVGSDILSEAPGDFIGTATAINGDGSIIAVGAPYNDSNGIGGRKS